MGNTIIYEIMNSVHRIIKLIIWNQKWEASFVRGKILNQIEMVIITSNVEVYIS